MSDTVILVGRRADGGHRDRLWYFCRDRWMTTTKWPVYIGVHDGPGPFSLSAASNRAAAVASDWEPDWQTAVYIGADWIVDDPAQAERAVTVAASTGRFTIAHDQTCHLSADATDRILHGAPLRDVWMDGAWNRNSFSGVVAWPRSLWEAVGGFDERFTGWGFEDMAAWSAACALGGGYERVPGVAVHLWHPTPWEQREGSLEHAENEPLGRRYIAGKGDPDVIRAILQEPGGPLS